MFLSPLASVGLLQGLLSPAPSSRSGRSALLSSTLAETPIARLEQICAAPRSPGAFELAERLSTRTLAEGSWRHAFRQLVTDGEFIAHGWAQCPFKLHERWDFAIGSFSMSDVEAYVTLMPPQFVASGVRWEQDGVVGIYNQPFADMFTFADVDARMDNATVVLLNAGFCIPALAAVSKAMLEATQLPIWLNVYLSKRGLATSTQLHTDKQDVLLIQTTGRKRWRVYKPPPPAEAPTFDPFARGKGVDLINPKVEDLVLDTVMEPGQVLYIPAGFPHETDTIGEVEDAAEGPAAEAAEAPSVHLTVGIDTHLWGLSYARMREVALERKGEMTTLQNGAPLTTLPLHEWSRIHSPLPLGFLAAPLLSEMANLGNLADGAEESASVPSAALVDVAAAEQHLCSSMAARLAQLLLDTEPERWAELGGGVGGAGLTPSQLLTELELEEVAARMLKHHREVLETQTRMYVRAAYARAGAMSKGKGAGALDALMDDMDALDTSTASLNAWASGRTMAAAAGAVFAAAGASGAGFGGKPNKATGVQKGGKPKKNKR